MTVLKYSPDCAFKASCCLWYAALFQPDNLDTKRDIVSACSPISNHNISFILTENSHIVSHVKVCVEFEHLTRVKMLVSYVKFHSFTCKIKDHIYVKINSHVQLLFGVCRIGMWKSILTCEIIYEIFVREDWLDAIPAREVCGLVFIIWNVFLDVCSLISSSNLRFYRVTLLPMIFPDHESWWTLTGHC